MANKFFFIIGFLLSSCFIFGQHLDSISTFPGFARDDAVAEFYGGKIYCGLGYGVGFQVMGDWWSYSIVNNSWKKLENVPFQKRQYSSSLVWENFIYVFAGWSSDSQIHKDLWRFNCIDKSWEEMQAIPSNARWGTMAVKIGDRALLGLGQDTSVYFNDAWIYNFKNDSWEQVPNYPGKARSKMLAVELNGMALIGLGQVKGSNENDLWLFNPLDNGWTEVVSKLDSLAYSSYVNFGNRVYFAGGQDYDGDFSSEFKVISFENLLVPKIIINSKIEPRARGNMIMDEKRDVYLLWGLDSNSQRTKKLERIQYQKQNTEVFKFDIFPNPASEQLLVQSNTNFEGLKIVNSSGLLISDLQFSSRTNFGIDISRFKAGIYFLSIHYNGSTNSTQTILIH